MFRNNTDWWIHRVYIDRRYVGQMASRGQHILGDVVAGPTIIYAAADFTDGSLWKCGPRTFPCPEQTTYTWTLNP